MTAVAEGLGDLEGVRHVTLASDSRGGTALRGQSVLAHELNSPIES